MTHSPIITVSAIVFTAAVLAGCNRTVAPLESASSLPAVPAGAVEQQVLDPVNPNDPTALPTETTPAETIVADTTKIEPVPTAASSAPVDRGSVAGVWDVSVAGGTCKFATSFTRRSQHYQASALRCPSPELSNVREWDVSGNQLVLYDASGAAIARLFKTAESRFDGKTSSGTALTFSRS